MIANTYDFIEVKLKNIIKSQILLLQFRAHHGTGSMVI